MTSPPIALVCTGFHRSGTSLAAKRLARAGLSLGEQLVPPHPSNPDGHYEDAVVVEVHDAWLRRQGSDWLFHDETALAGDAMLATQLAEHIARRDAGGDAWAVKDPRLCLVLPDWDRILGERGRYLLMVRHWGECAQSLFHRHSREMAHHLLDTRPGANPNFRFWLDPNAVYAAWLAYNQRVLEFAAARRGQAVIVTARAMAALESLAPLVASRLGVPLTTPDADAGLRPELLSRRLTVAILPPPPLWLRRRLDATWADLLALADGRSADEGVDWNARGLPDWQRAGVERVVGDGFPAAAAAPVVAPAPAEPLERTLALMEALPPPQAATRALAAARRAFADRRSGGRRLDDAETVLARALALDLNPYPLRLLLGDVQMERQLPAAARIDYEAARALRRTEQGEMKLVRCLMALKDWRAAIEVLEPLLASNPAQVDAHALLARCLDALGSPDLAAQALAELPDAALGLRNTRAQLVLAYDVDGGMRLYHDVIRQKLGERDLVGWLAGACASIPTAAAWSAFVEAVVRHWQQVLGGTETALRLQLPTLPDWTAHSERRASFLALGGSGGPGLQAALACLQDLDWLSGPGLDSGLADTGFAAALPPALAASDPDDDALHQALHAFLHGIGADLPALADAGRGWLCWHPGTAWFAAALLARLPALRYVHVLDRADAAADGWQAWTAAARAGGGGGMHGRLEYAVALQRQALSLQARFPGRVFLLDPRRAAADPAHVQEWLQFLGLPEGEATLAALRGRFTAGLAPANVADLALADPVDVAWLRAQGLLAPA